MKNTTQISCRKFEEELPDYIAGRLNPVVSAKMLAHSQKCQTCAQAEQTERALRIRFANAPLITEIPDLLPNLKSALKSAPKSRQPLFMRPQFPQIWKLGTVGSSMVAAAGLLFYMNAMQTPVITQNPNSEKFAVNNAETTPIAVQEISQIGQSESRLIVEETNASRQFGLPSSSDGDL